MLSNQSLTKYTNCRIADCWDVLNFMITSFLSVLGEIQIYDNGNLKSVITNILYVKLLISKFNYINLLVTYV